MMAVDPSNWDQSFPPLLQSHLFTQENSNFKPFTKSYSSCFTSSASASVSTSPAESEQDSTMSSESDQDDDDYIAELTRKMAQYMLQDEENIHGNETQEGWSAEWPNLGKKDESENLHKDGANHTDTDGFLSEKPTTSILDFRSKQALIDEQIRNIQFMKQQRWQNEINRRQIYESKSRGLNLEEQQHRRSGSEMRAVFLGEPGSKGGTGVFLPRRVTNPNNSRKKAGCSTVLIPARVLEALQLHFDRKGTDSQHSPPTFLKHNVNMRKGQQQSQSETTVPAMNNKEIGLLPQEWTY